MVTIMEKARRRPAPPRLEGVLVWQYDSVDYVNHAVGGFDISGYNVGSINGDATSVMMVTSPPCTVVAVIPLDRSPLITLPATT